MTLLEDYFEDKYTGNSDGRFRDQIGEYHASNVSNCPRAWYWDFTREGEDSWSPYFELGRMFERMYGRALKWKYGDRAKQDVQIEIEIADDITIVGESDWVIFEEDAPRVDKVILKQDGSREFIEDDDRIDILSQLKDLRYSLNSTERINGTFNKIIDKLEEAIGEPRRANFNYDGQIEKVIETKTTGELKWRRKYGYKDKHLYQLSTYMWAFDAPGDIVYMTRNEADMMTFEFTRDEQIERDIEIRARAQDRNLKTEEVPDTDPLNENACKWCEWKAECKLMGGSRWE